MKRKQNGNKEETTTAKDGRRKEVSVQRDIRTFFFRSAPGLENRPDGYETGDSDFEESFLTRVGQSTSSKNPLENNRFRRTFDIEAALRYKASKLQHNGEFTTLYEPNVAFSLILRVLRNGGFFHVKTQEDVALIRTPLSKQEQNEHLAWILDPENLPHRGFRTGAELILLSEAGMNMISFDRSDSTKKIDEIRQTIVADSWGFNRLSNSLSERATDNLLREILAGDYAEGDAAFQRRNGGGEPKMLSREWEETIERKWGSMSSEAKTQQYNSRRQGPIDPNYVFPDIRFWGLDGGLPQFQRLCRLNANGNGNLVDEISGFELTPCNWGVDRVINGIARKEETIYKTKKIKISYL
ncbi:hypothetical protein HK100_004366 [Physocladia obscura]|uniref:Uncharacterized protein n=1 Tax=Physocladia obscura TaxID=109957 RepID=A0AAD5SYL8_9FUNG|nr:hypothetical protein HK100_004366 [Physocladia obscura]